jgi:hypothetical protein
MLDPMRGAAVTADHGFRQGEGLVVHDIDRPPPRRHVSVGRRDELSHHPGRASKQTRRPLCDPPLSGLDQPAGS